MIQNSLLLTLNNNGYITDNFIQDILKLSIENNDINIFESIISTYNIIFIERSKYLHNIINFIIQNNLKNILNIFYRKTTNKYIHNSYIYELYEDIDYVKILCDNDVKISITTFMGNISVNKYIFIKNMYIYKMNKLEKTGYNRAVFNSIFGLEQAICNIFNNCLYNECYYNLYFLYKLLPLSDSINYLISNRYIINDIDYIENDINIVVKIFMNIYNKNNIEFRKNIFKLDNLYFKLARNRRKYIIKFILSTETSGDILVYIYNLYIDYQQFGVDLTELTNYLIYEILNNNIEINFTDNLIKLFDSYNVFNKVRIEKILNNKYIYKHTNFVKFLYNKYKITELNNQSIEYSDLNKLTTLLNIDYPSNFIIYNSYGSILHRHKSNFSNTKEIIRDNIFYCLKRDIISVEILLFESIINNLPDIFKYIIDNGYNIKKHNNLLLKVVCKFNNVNMLQILNEYRISFKSSILSKIAVENNHPEVLEYLINQHCNINMNTKLYDICVKKNSIDCLKILYKYNYGGNYNTLFKCCITDGKIDILKFLLLNNLIDSDNYEPNPYILLNNEIFKYMIQNNIKIPNIVYDMKLKFKHIKYLIFDKKYRKRCSIEKYIHHFNPIICNIVILNTILVKDICIHIMDILLNL